MIVVFTGTGNSLYVGKYLGQLLKDEVVDVKTYIRERKRARFKSDTPWIFLAPTYVSAPPKIYMKFLEKSSFEGAKEAYFIATCAGGMGACPWYFEKLSGKMGLVYRGTAAVKMPQNYLVFFKTKEKEENLRIIREAEPAVQALAEKIQRGEAFADPGMKKWEVLATEAILELYYRGFMKAKAFKAGKDCIGCGRCERVCPMKNIRMKEDRPHWGETCTHCMACIGSCPKKTIEYGRLTKGKPRYVCPPYVKKEFMGNQSAGAGNGSEQEG